jgi:hypothetical protein
MGRLIELGHFVPVTEPLVNYRLHDDSISHQHRITQVERRTAIALRHCAHLLGLPASQAQRAYQILATMPGQRRWRDWGWFLTKGLRRLRWWSPELAAWILSQSLQMAAGRGNRLSSDDGRPV